MAILKCEHCGHSKEVAEQYADKTVKCPSCGQAAKVYDTIVLLTAFSEKMSEFQTELSQLKQLVAQPQLSEQVNEELVQTLAKIFREQRIAMTEFNDATKRRDTITLRTERHTLLLARFGMAGFFILLIILVFFMIRFADSARWVSEQVLDIGNQANVMSDDIHSIKEVLAKLNPSVAREREENTVPLNEIQDSLAAMQNKVKEMNENLSRLTARVEDLAQKESNSRYYYR